MNIINTSPHQQHINTGKANEFGRLLEDLTPASLTNVVNERNLLNGHVNHVGAWQIAFLEPSHTRLTIVA
jgi:hypothetical protein